MCVLQAALAKKEKETLKKALRKERKSLRTVCKVRQLRSTSQLSPISVFPLTELILYMLSQTYNYFASGDAEVVRKMQDVERLCNSLSLERLQQVNEQLAQLGQSESQALVEQELEELDRREKEKMDAAAASSAQSKSLQGTAASVTSSDWTVEEVQLLVKAVTMFPAGTVKRWDTIAKYINTHSGKGSREKVAKQVISKVKTLQKLEGEEKSAQNKMAYTRFEQQHTFKEKGKVQAEAAPTERYGTYTYNLLLVYLVTS